MNSEIKRGKCSLNMLCGCFALSLAFSAEAGKLDPAGWNFTGANAADMKKALDDDLGTAWESGCPQTKGVSLTIDLGQSMSVYRVYLNCGRELSKFPRSLNIYVGETPESLQPVASEVSRNNPDENSSGDLTALRTESLFRFSPAKGRYVKLEIGPNGTAMPWAIAEMDIHAVAQEPGKGKEFSIVLNGSFLKSKDGKAAPFNLMKLAAEELQYYLMELTDTPVVIVPSEDAKSVTGARFHLVTPPPETVPSPEPDPVNLDDVTIKKVAKDVVISGLTARSVLYGVYEFLEAQGVRWLFADPNGDWVPEKKELDLSMLPLMYRPPFTTRGLIWPGVVGMSEEDFNLFQLRHRFNMASGMGGRVPLGTVPRMNCGFGWAHTMGGLFSEKGKDGKSPEEQHPEWWPGPYRKGWSKIPCVSNPEVLEFILKKMEDTVKDRIDKKLPPLQGFSVHPNDSPCFCECPNCEKIFGKPRRIDPDGADDSNGTYDYADRHFYLINALAERLKEKHPELFLKTLAYSNHELAPKSFDKVPDNVLVDICPWWKPLPVSAPQNAPIRDNIKAWGPKCGSIGIWSYVLIYSDTTFGYPSGEKNLVVTNLRALLDQNKFYKEFGIRQVSTQLYGPQKHWPWGFYAFAVSTWRPDLAPETVQEDFFKGYYGEAWEPMLEWYEEMEKAALEKNIDTEAPDPRLFEGGRIEKLRSLIAEAGKLAKRWFVKERISTAADDTEWTYEKSQWKTTSKDRPYPCHRVKEAPVIDGKMDDASWKSLPEMKGFRIAATRMDAAHPGRFAFKHLTSFKMGWDDKFLYLAMRCMEPDIDKTKEADAKQKAFEYRNAIEIFHAPEAPPYYRQTMIDSAGKSWGPMKIRQVNSHQPIEDPDFSCGTAYENDAWTLEARFPLKMLSDTQPKEWTTWPANLVHPCMSADDGEKFSSWSDLPRYQFHQYNLGSWSIIEFKGDAPKDISFLEKTMNAEFLRSSQKYDDQKKRLAAFNEKIKDKPNLSDPALQKGVSFKPGDRNTRQFELVWSGEPVSFNAVRINWQDRRLYKNWYTLEYWDGSQFKLVEDRRNNDSEVSIHEFEPVKASRLRLTTWDEMTGWRDMPSVKSIDVFMK